MPSLRKRARRHVEKGARDGGDEGAEGGSLSGAAGKAVLFFHLETEGDHDAAPRERGKFHVTVASSIPANSVWMRSLVIRIHDQTLQYEVAAESAREGSRMALGGRRHRSKRASARQATAATGEEAVAEGGLYSVAVPKLPFFLGRVLKSAKTRGDGSKAFVAGVCLGDSSGKSSASSQSTASETDAIESASAQIAQGTDQQSDVAHDPLDGGDGEDSEDGEGNNIELSAANLGTPYFPKRYVIHRLIRPTSLVTGLPSGDGADGKTSTASLPIQKSPEEIITLPSSDWALDEKHCWSTTILQSIRLPNQTKDYAARRAKNIASRATVAHRWVPQFGTSILDFLEEGHTSPVSQEKCRSAPEPMRENPAGEPLGPQIFQLVVFPHLVTALHDHEHQVRSSHRKVLLPCKVSVRDILKQFRQHFATELHALENERFKMIVDDIEPVFNAFIGKLLFPSEVAQHKAALAHYDRPASFLYGGRHLLLFILAFPWIVADSNRKDTEEVQASQPVSVACDQEPSPLSALTLQPSLALAIAQLLCSASCIRYQALLQMMDCQCAALMGCDYYTNKAC